MLRVTREGCCIATPQDSTKGCLPFCQTKAEFFVGAVLRQVGRV